MSQEQIRQFLKLQKGNKWFWIGKLEVYLRCGTRTINYEVVTNVVDLANFTNNGKLRQGKFTDFLNWFEDELKLNNWHYLYIENVIAGQWLIDYFKRRDYLVDQASKIPCLYKKLI